MRHFFHSFPRRKNGEPDDALDARALGILKLFKEIGFVLAPEVVSWDASALSLNAEVIRLLQRRASFTELSDEELPRHAEIFGPISLAFEINALRHAGAVPVIYAPQGVSGTALSHLGVFCVRSAWHTRAVLDQLNALRSVSDPALIEKQWGLPPAEECEITLTNTDPLGNVVSERKVLSKDVDAVMKYVGYESIPFDHSIGMLNVFMNMFYPTDNEHAGLELGYYRQREWRLIAGDINVGDRPLGRPLSDAERARVLEVDRAFWTRSLEYKGEAKPRIEWALVYDPEPGWNLFDHIHSIRAPERLQTRIRNMVGDDVAILAIEEI